MSTGAGSIFGNPMNSLNTWSSPPGGSGGGSNQWMSNYPALPNFNPSFSPDQVGAGPGSSHTVPIGGAPYVGHGMYQNPTFDPKFTGQFYSMLEQLLGGGGGLQNQLLSFLSGGKSNIPGADSLTSMAETGNPISALPEWQKMIEAQQRQIGEGATNLKEQFAFMGDLASSPFATGMSDYFSQTTKDQNALLGQLDTQAMEAAMQRELAASQDIMGMTGAETQFLDQLFSQGALASPGLNKKSSSSILGGIGSLIGAGASGASAGLAASAGGAGDISAILAGLAAI